VEEPARGSLDHLFLRFPGARDHNIVRGSDGARLLSFIRGASPLSRSVHGSLATFQDNARLSRATRDFSGQGIDVSGQHATFQGYPRFFRTSHRRFRTSADFSGQREIFEDKPLPYSG